MNQLIALPLSEIPPWTAMSILFGLANAALIFLIVGRSVLRLPLYLIGGAAVGALAQPLSLLIGPGNGALMVGEVSFTVVSAVVWLTLCVAWALGL